MPNKSRKSFSQPLFRSTPRRHSRGSPVAHRTRRQISFRRAIELGLCKMCFRTFPDSQTLWDHLRDFHASSPRRDHCLNAFPLEYHFYSNDANAAQVDREFFFGPGRLFSHQPPGPPMHCSEPVSPATSPHDVQIDLTERGLLRESSVNILSRSRSLDSIMETGLSQGVKDVSLHATSLPCGIDSAKVVSSPLPPLSLRQSHRPCDLSPSAEDAKACTSPGSQGVLIHDSPESPNRIRKAWNDATHEQVSLVPVVHEEQSNSDNVPLAGPASPTHKPAQASQPPICELSPRQEDAGSVAVNSEQVAAGQSDPDPVQRTRELSQHMEAACQSTPQVDSVASPPSPDILEIVLGGDVSLPVSPDLSALREKWGNQITGSPPSPAFSSKTYAQVVKKGQTSAQRAALLECTSCKRKFYTESGRRVHACAAINSSPGLDDFCKYPPRSLPTNTAQTKKSVKGSKLGGGSKKPPVSSKASSQARQPRVKVNPSPPHFEARSVKVRCQFCEKLFNSEAALQSHMTHLHKITPTPGTSRLRPVSSPPKNGRWCPFCVGYVFDNLPKATHEETFHPLQIVVKKSTLGPLACDSCSFVAKSKKGLVYHKRSFHNPASTTLNDQAIDDPVQLAISSEQPTTSSSVSVAPPIAAASSSDNSHPDQRDITLSGSNLTFSFPISRVFCCPIENCSFRCKTKNWYTSNTSLKRHLGVFHKRRDLVSQTFCKSCKTSFKTRPSKHTCLRESGLFLSGNLVTFQWVCQECGVDFPTKIGLDNHSSSHKKELIAARNVKLQLPIPPKARRESRRKRVARHAEGSPSNAPLAAPAPPRRTPEVVNEAHASNSGNVEPEVPTPEERGLVDIPETRILSSFREPLNQLIEHDDLQDADETFFRISEDLISVVRDHFRIKKPNQNSGQQGPRTSEIDLLDPQAVQRCYGWNRRKLIRHLTEANSHRCNLPRETISSHFQTIWQAPSEELLSEETERPDRPPVVHTFTPKFVSECLQSAENSAPGPDGIMYKHWREIDPGSTVLCAIFNICIKLKRVPPSWKAATTVLIHKKGAVENIDNWRPIALSNTMYKLFTKCLARRLSDWFETFEVLSPSQKGFTPFDGVIEHNFLLSQHIESARTHKTESLVAWLDLSNAFGSVPHQAIFSALANEGVDQDFIDLVSNLYDGASSSILTNEGPTDQIPILRGVKQGCPLSGALFNLVINKTLKEVQGAADEKKILAFADDLVLLANDQDELQSLLDLTCTSLQKLQLSLNPDKCATLHLSGQTPVGSRPTRFLINEVEIRSLNDGESFQYLGKPVGFWIGRNYSSVNDAIRDGHKIATSKLSPWQKLDALKSFFFPALNFAMRTAQFPKGDWRLVQNALTKELKEILSLPPKASISYLFGDKAQGGCGIPEITKDCDFYLVDTAFKLLTSADEEIAVKALGQLTKTVRHRIRREPTNGDLASFLSGAMEEVEDTSNAVQNTWTLARVASRRQNITWTFTEDLPSLSFDGNTITGTNRKKILKTLHRVHREDHIERLLSLKSQGKAMECVSAHPASNHFLGTGRFTRFADWRFIHPARLNLLPVNGAKQWTDGSSKRCRRCGAPNETLPHVLNHCRVSSAAWTRRHNAVLQRVRKAVAFRGQILSENQTVGKTGLRPDLVAKIDDKLCIIDVTIPFDNRLASFEVARRTKTDKYAPLLQHFKSLGHREVQIVPIVVGSLGGWDVANDQFLKTIATKSYLTILRKLCVSDSIRWSRDIYVEHMTGHRQFDNEHGANFEPSIL
ncbi:retrovirus-related Pol polyprotein from type-1 retrotransposable element R2 [Trichonephila clavata]|uniref:Retrovirus-related Pol polyprotein from type-1 retrotransposable element R2 n=1 Tax=Trichonephila clavata TaxID=2740835 RepID=A0A8X6HT18_TRICU|nr:retrovirus-related Pol polyprotein from type-1 retrotransposable element R2 [Trichonephila clavata]